MHLEDHWESQSEPVTTTGKSFVSHLHGHLCGVISTCKSGKHKDSPTAEIASRVLRHLKIRQWSPLRREEETGAIPGVKDVQPQDEIQMKSLVEPNKMVFFSEQEHPKWESMHLRSHLTGMMQVTNK